MSYCVSYCHIGPVSLRTLRSVLSVVTQSCFLSVMDIRGRPGVGITLDQSEASIQVM